MNIKGKNCLNLCCVILSYSLVSVIFLFKNANILEIYHSPYVVLFFN
nr:MAG TPA: hypothetical protein [Caudoviricetes sp.]